MMKMIKVQDAVGSILSHDVTQIIPGEFKGRAFKKGHIIKEEDIEKIMFMYGNQKKVNFMKMMQP